MLAPSLAKEKLIFTENENFPSPCSIGKHLIHFYQLIQQKHAMFLDILVSHLGVEAAQLFVGKSASSFAQLLLLANWSTSWGAPE